MPVIGERSPFPGVRASIQRRARGIDRIISSTNHAKRHRASSRSQWAFGSDEPSSSRMPVFFKEASHVENPRARCPVARAPHRQPRIGLTPGLFTANPRAQVQGRRRSTAGGPNWSPRSRNERGSTASWLHARKRRRCVAFEWNGVGSNPLEATFLTQNHRRHR